MSSGPVAESQRFPVPDKSGRSRCSTFQAPATGFALTLPNQTLDRLRSDRHVRLEQLGRQPNEFSPVTRPSNIGIYTSGETTSVKNPNGANWARLTKAQRISDREHMNRPLGEYQKNMIDGVLKKYGKYTVKRPIDKQTIRCLNSLVKRELVTFDAETGLSQAYRYPTRLRKPAVNAKLPFVGLSSDASQ
jgi:hypothetical protein